MRIEERRRVHPGGSDYHYDLVLIAENETESAMLNKLGSTPDDNGLISQGWFEIRVSHEHYVLLQVGRQVER